MESATGGKPYDTYSASDSTNNMKYSQGTLGIKLGSKTISFINLKPKTAAFTIKIDRKDLFKINCK